MKRMNEFLLLIMLTAGCTASAPQDRRTLAIVEKGVSSVGFYTEDGERLAGVPVDTMPHEMVLTPDRRYAYIGNNGSIRFVDEVDGGSTITVIDLKERTRVRTISLLPWRRPHALDLDPATGLLAVGVENPDQLLLVDSQSGDIVRHFKIPGKTPHWVTFSPDGKRAFVSCVLSSNIAIVQLETGRIDSIAVGERPQGTALSLDGRELYVACDNYVAVVSMESLTEVAHIGTGANRVDLTSDGRLLLYACTKNGVGFADPATREVLDYIELPYRPFSMHLSIDEQLAYVAAEEQGIVYTISVPERQIIREFKTPDGFRPDPVFDIYW